MTPAEKPEEKPDEAAPRPAAEPRKYYLLVGKGPAIRGPFTAKELSDDPDFVDGCKIAPLGATKSSHWKPAEKFDELRAVLEARKAAAQAAKPAAETAKPTGPR